MSQNSEKDKAAMLAVIEKINEVSGFDPTPFAVEFTDLETGEVRKRLPVMIQMAWFRLKYPEGRIAVRVTPGKECFTATARVYPSYKDSDECYLAEATASRGYLADKPSVSPREWAQTAAVGIALRNAGFGLQFAMAGEEFGAVAPNELEAEVETTVSDGEQATATGASDRAEPILVKQLEVETASVKEQKPLEKELTDEDKLQQAMEMPCPIKKYQGKTLGDLLVMDANALKWVATKFSDEGGIQEAAQRICEYALQQVSA